MRKIIPLILTGTLAAMTLAAQSIAAQSMPAQSRELAQGQDDISISEFRQALSDMATALDSARGTDLARMIPGLSDDVLQGWYRGVPNGRRFANAAAEIKSMRLHPTGGRRETFTTPGTQPGYSPIHRQASESGFAAGITSTPIPDVSLATPEYPSGSNWSNMTATLQGVGSLPSGNVSDKYCGANGNSALSTAVSTFNGIKDIAELICNAIPDPVVIVLGSGTRIPAKEICFVADLIIGAFNSAFIGYLADCQMQSSLVLDAQNNATLGNITAMYNLEFRLAAEEALGNQTYLTGIFEIPDSQGGYLDSARAITSDIITKMTNSGYVETVALGLLTQGDNAYNQRNYKLAFKQYQKAYAAAVL
jgi:hypothetical protein